MTMTEWVLDGVGVVSGKLAQVEQDDDLEGLAGLLGASELLRDRLVAKLEGRVAQFAIDEAKTEAKTALGW